MNQEEIKLDCRTQVITPENIQFEYALAGPFQRLPAFLFDVVVRSVVFFALTVILSMVLSLVPFGSTLTTIWSLIGFFVLSWFYGVLFEAWFNGRTIGKMVFKLRSISTDGRPINATQAALRNMLRLADMQVYLSLEFFAPDAPPVYVIPTMSIGLITMMLTRKSQRLGDLVAGTMVISEARKVAPWNIKPEDSRAFGLAELIPANFQPTTSMTQTIGLYMENRARLNPLRRNDIAKHLARPLIEEFELLPDTGYDLLLCALYVRIYMSDDQQAEGKAKMRRERQVGQSRLAPTGLAAAVAAPAAPPRMPTSPGNSLFPPPATPSSSLPPTSNPQVPAPPAPSDAMATGGVEIIEAEISNPQSKDPGPQGEHPGR